MKTSSFFPELNALVVLYILARIAKDWLTQGKDVKPTHLIKRSKNSRRFESGKHAQVVMLSWNSARDVTILLVGAGLNSVICVLRSGSLVVVPSRTKHAIVVALAAQQEAESEVIKRQPQDGRSPSLLSG